MGLPWQRQVRPERMPAVPMNKTKYHSLVDAWRHALTSYVHLCPF